MKRYTLLALCAATLLFGGCAGTEIGSVGVGGTYTDPETGAVYGGNVNVNLRDRDPKRVRKPQAKATKPEFWPSLARGLARMADGPKPDTSTGPSLEQILFPLPANP